jgi:diguanylate cyclase (GGDEF)-like protein/PAS domain S-box-containing protein
MFSLDPQLVGLALGDARLATWEWNVSADQVRWTSGQFDIYARPASEINSSLAWSELVHADDRQRVQQAVENALQTGTGFREQFRVAGRDGKTIWVIGYGKVVRAPDQSLSIFGLNIDVTDWVDTLAASEARFTATFEQAAVGIAHVGTDGKWLDVNRRCCEIVGYTKEELLKLTFADITHPGDVDADLSMVRTLLRGDKSTYTAQKRYLTGDKRIVWVNLTVALVRDSSGRPDYFISVIEDITARKQVEEERDGLIAELEWRVRERTAELEKLSRTDGLTGVANRRHLDEQFEMEWDRAVRTGQPISIVIIDIDHFKGLNDSAGHGPADQALIALAHELSRIGRRPADLTARYGGDEFVLVLPETGSEGAMVVARQVHAAVHRLDIPNPGSPVTGKMTVTQGVATAWPARKEMSNRLMVAADRALYEAKQAGRDRICAADASALAMDGVHGE